MREIIYLSKRKLDNFMEPKKMISSLRRLKRVETSAAQLAEFSLEAHPPSKDEEKDAYVKKLERVIRKIKPKSVDEVNISPGDWVAFDSRMVHAELSGSHMRGVVFLSGSGLEREGRRSRLFLHGSSEHYLLASPARADIDEEVTETRFSLSAEYSSGGVSFRALVHNVDQVVHALEGEENFSSGSPQKTENPESFTLGSMKLLAALDKHLDSSYFSERVSGLARLTCEPMQISSDSEEEEQERGRLLVGTPLYVEYSR